MSKEQAELTISAKMRNQFRNEIRENVKHKLDEINHYVSGCNSPFTYMQIADVQESLRNIADVLGIKGADE